MPTLFIKIGAIIAGLGLTVGGWFGYHSFQAGATSVFAIFQGGTATSTQVTNGVNYSDGSKITSGTSLVFTGTNLGIGTTTPDSPLTINGTTSGLQPLGAFTGTIIHMGAADGLAPRFILDSFANNGTLIMRRANGTSASPTNVTTDNVLASYDGTGYGATAMAGAARGRLRVVAGEAWTDTAQGTYINFLTTANGGIGTTEKMRIDGNGNVGIGTTTPQTRLHVSNGASATTTVTVGELGLTSSKACVNMNRSDGGAGSFYINAAGVMVAESNYCK